MFILKFIGYLYKQNRQLYPKDGWLVVKPPQLRPFRPCQRADVRRTKLLQGWNPIPGAVISVTADCIKATSALLEPVRWPTSPISFKASWILWLKILVTATTKVDCLGLGGFQLLFLTHLQVSKCRSPTRFDSNHWLGTHHAFPVFGQRAVWQLRPSGLGPWPSKMASYPSVINGRLSGKSLNQMELPMGKFIGRFAGVMGVPIMVLSASSLNHVETHDYWPHAQSLIQLFN